MNNIIRNIIIFLRFCIEWRWTR